MRFSFFVGGKAEEVVKTNYVRLEILDLEMYLPQSPCWMSMHCPPCFSESCPSSCVSAGVGSQLCSGTAALTWQAAPRPYSLPFPFLGWNNPCLPPCLRSGSFPGCSSCSYIPLRLFELMHRRFWSCPCWAYLSFCELFLLYPSLS